MYNINKTINRKYAIFQSLCVLALAAIILQSCSGGAGGESPRNKMPEFTDLSNGFEGNGCGFQTRHINDNKEFGLTVSNVDIGFMGTTAPCVSVALPSAADDSAAFNLVHTYGRFALPLMSEWSKRNRNGVVLDLRESRGIGNSQHKAEYLINAINSNGIPVIFLWDQASDWRAAGYIKMLEQLNGISYRRVSIN